MEKKLTLSGNAETVGYVVDAINNKKIRYEIEGAEDSFKFDDYEVKSIHLNPSKKDPYHANASLNLKGTSFDLGLLTNIVKKLYPTLKVA